MPFYLWLDTVYLIQVDLVTALLDAIQMRSAPLTIDIKAPVVQSEESRTLPAAPLIDRQANEIRSHRLGSMRLINFPSLSPPPPIRREPVGRQDYRRPPYPFIPDAIYYSSTGLQHLPVVHH